MVMRKNGGFDTNISNIIETTAQREPAMGALTYGIGNWVPEFRQKQRLNSLNSVEIKKKKKTRVL